MIDSWDWLSYDCSGACISWTSIPQLLSMITSLHSKANWCHQHKMAAIVPEIFWLDLCTVTGSGDVSSLFIYSLWFCYSFLLTLNGWFSCSWYIIPLLLRFTLLGRGEDLLCLWQPPWLLSIFSMYEACATLWEPTWVFSPALMAAIASGVCAASSSHIGVNTLLGEMLQHNTQCYETTKCFIRLVDGSILDDNIILKYYKIRVSPRKERECKMSWFYASFFVVTLLSRM